MYVQMTPVDLPAPDDPRPRTESIVLSLSSGEQVPATDDAYSDRIRCDHPDTRDSRALGRALLEAALDRRRGRVVVLVPEHLRFGLEDVGFYHEATIPGFYRGDEACTVLGYALEPSRYSPADAAAAKKVYEIVHSKGGDRVGRQEPPTLAGTPRDAGPIARLLADTFEHYPTPSGVPGYIEEQMRQGIPFRVVRGEGEIMACASADLVPQARTAELTDCATRPDVRGRGLMRGILMGLMDDLRQLGYPTAFTLARARVVGVNLVFARLGFKLRGRMNCSCRIGSGMEDMNVWSRRL